MNNGVGILCPLTLDCIYTHVPHFPQDGEEVYAEQFSMQLGGGSVVSAMRLQNAGIPVTMGTFWNAGLLSQIALQCTQRLGFYDALQNLCTGEAEPIIVSTVFSDARERSIVSSKTNYDENSLSDAQLFTLLSGNRLSAAPHRPAVLKALREEGQRLFYDVHWTEQLSLRQEGPVLELVDYFTPNEKEAMALTQTDSAQAALQTLQNYTACPIVKCGREGVLFYAHGKVQSLVPPKARTKDTTGAGDNFLAGLLFGVYKGYPLEKALALANAAGAASTEGIGCFPTHFNLPDLEQNLKEERIL